MTEAGGLAAPLDSLIDIDGTFLPVGRMRQIARVTELDERSITGEVDLGQDHWVFEEHFPGDPIFPGTFLIEAAGQLVALWAWARGLRGKPRLVRTRADFHNPVRPDIDALELRSELKGKKHLSFGTTTIWAKDEKVATVEAVLAVLPSTD